jgi:hypothetical protein
MFILLTDYRVKPGNDKKVLFNIGLGKSHIIVGLRKSRVIVGLDPTIY